MAETEDPYHGLLPGHLSDSQEAAFQTLKQQVIDEKLVVPTEELVYKPEDQKEYDDATILRYLRARKWIIEGAMKQLRATSEWFIKEDVEHRFDLATYDDLAPMGAVYPRWTGGRTRAGNMLFVYRLDQITPERIKKYNEHQDTLRGREHILTRFTTSFYFPLANALPRPRPDIPIDHSESIIDMTNVGISGFWALRSLLQTTAELANLHLPETAGIVYIVGAPGYWHAIFKLIKRWFDEGTTDKIQLLQPSEVLSRLSATIDPKAIPKQYGGESDWHWDRNGGKPELDDDIKDLLGLKSSSELPNHPLRFHHKTGLGVVGSGRTEAELKYNGRGRREDTAAKPSETNGADDKVELSGGQTI